MLPNSTKGKTKSSRLNSKEKKSDADIAKKNGSFHFKMDLQQFDESDSNSKNGWNYTKNKNLQKQSALSKTENTNKKPQQPKGLQKRRVHQSFSHPERSQSQQGKKTSEKSLILSSIEGIMSKAKQSLAKSSHKRAEKSPFLYSVFSTNEAEQSAYKHLSTVEDDNVFYEDSYHMQILSTYTSTLKFLSFLFLVVFLSWFTVWSIDGFKGQCPRHAECGAYVNCHRGYILQVEQISEVEKRSRQSSSRDHQDDFHYRCVVDPEIKQNALFLMESAVRDLKFEWGNNQCKIYELKKQNHSQGSDLSQRSYSLKLQQYKEAPKRSYESIFKAYDVEERILQNELIHAFNDRNYQKINEFEVDSISRIVPLEKYYSFDCRIEIFYQNYYQTFVVLCVTGIGVLLSSVCAIVGYLERKEAAEEFKRYKQEVKRSENQEIRINDFKRLRESKSKNNRFWKLINRTRVEEGSIGMFVDEKGSQIWKMLE